MQELTAQSDIDDQIKSKILSFPPLDYKYPDPEQETRQDIYDWESRKQDCYMVSFPSPTVVSALLLISQAYDWGLDGRRGKHMINIQIRKK